MICKVKNVWGILPNSILHVYCIYLCYSGCHNLKKKHGLHYYVTPFPNPMVVIMLTEIY